MVDDYRLVHSVRVSDDEVERKKRNVKFSDEQINYELDNRIKSTDVGAGN